MGVTLDSTERTVNSTGLGEAPDSHAAGTRGSLALWWRSRFGLRLLLEVGLVAGLLLTYMRVRQFTRGDLRAAFENTREVIQFERWIGLPFEDDLQRALLNHPDLVRFLNHYYLWFHFPVAIGLLAWLYWRHNDHYFYIRRLMAVVTFVALVIHVAYPLAPPRMMPGFVDTMYRLGPSIYSRNTLEGAANQIAAMPSLHFGWAVIAAMAVIHVNRSRWRYVAVVHPFLMGTAIVATANHWWVDAAAAGLIIFLCWAVAKVVSRLLAAREDREQAWEDGAYTPVSARTSSSNVRC